jgi:single-stranded-DNA-specific exonuclease
MRAAVERLWQAVEKREQVTIYGDYDVDGITATALLLNVLNAFDVPCSYFIPTREHEGYGLSKTAISRCLSDLDPDIVVTVDCGSGASAETALLKDSGVDVVVTDHHEARKPNEAATALVNPKAAGDPATKMLSGVGVAFKLCHALQKMAFEQGHAAAERIDLRCFLDLVALGTVADIVPLTGENRILVKAGLKRLENSPSHGLKELIAAAGLKKCTTCHEIGFRLGPRLNAAGRTGDAAPALDLLLTQDKHCARNIAQKLNQANDLRRDIEDRVRKEAEDLLESGDYADGAYGIVLDGTKWPVGVIGIVASRLCKQYNRPVVVISADHETVCRGSARSPEGIDFSLVDALEKCSKSLLAYGGHRSAAGLEVAPHMISQFREDFCRVCHESLAKKDMWSAIGISSWLSPDDLSMELVREIDLLRPFGPGNEGPLWGIRRVTVAEPPRAVGRNHLKLRLKAGDRTVEAIGFGMAGLMPDAGDVLDVVFELIRNDWRGRSNMQMKIVDLRASG